MLTVIISFQISCHCR